MGILAWDKTDVLWGTDNTYLQNALNIKLDFISFHPENRIGSFNTLPVEQYISPSSYTTSYSCSKHFTPQSGDLSELINDVGIPCVFYAQPGIYFISDTIRLTNQTLVAEPSGFREHREAKDSFSLFKQLSGRASYSRSFVASLAHNSLGYIIGKAWYQHKEVKQDKIIIVPVIDSNRQQKNEWVYLQNNSHLSDIILVGSDANDGFTGVVSDFSSNTLGETGYLTRKAGWFNYLQTERGGEDKGDKRKSQAEGGPPRKKSRIWGSFRRKKGSSSFSGGSGGNGRDDDEDRKKKPTGHMNPVWGVIPVSVAGLDKLSMILRALLAYLFIPGETADEFINRLGHVIDYFQHSVTSGNDDRFMENLLIQLGRRFGLDLTSSTNMDSLLNELYSDTETIQKRVLQQSDITLKAIIEKLLANLVWLTNPDGGEMLVDIQSLVDNSASATIKPLQRVKETINKNQQDIIRHAELTRQIMIKNKIEEKKIKTNKGNGEEVLLSLFKKFFTIEAGQKFFTGERQAIITILSEYLDSEQITQLSIRLGLGRDYYHERLYDRLESLILKFVENRGKCQRLVQSIVDLLGERVEDAIDRIRGAVTRVPSVGPANPVDDIDTLLGRMTISSSASSSSASPDTPPAPEAFSPEPGNHPVLPQPDRDQIISGLESFLLNNQTEEASSEPLNSQAINQLSNLFTAGQVRHLHRLFRADDPWVQHYSQYEPTNISSVIQAFLVSYQGSDAFRKLAMMLYLVLEQTMITEDIGYLLRGYLKNFQLGTGSEK